MERVTAGVQLGTANHGLNPGGTSYEKTVKLFRDSNRQAGKRQIFSRTNPFSPASNTTPLCFSKQKRVENAGENFSCTILDS